MPTLPVDGRVLFFRRDRAEFGFLSNFHAAPVVIDAITWPTTEHFYQAQKSFDPRFREAVRAATTPGQAKRLGTAPDRPRRQSHGSWFRLHDTLPRDDWMSVRVDVMRTALRAKFGQHDALRTRLRATDPAELVEDSAYDEFWGVGREGTGENWLGRLLMEVRAALRDS